VPEDEEEEKSIDTQNPGIQKASTMELDEYYQMKEINAKLPPANKH
jgi:hypothetical protein